MTEDYDESEVTTKAVMGFKLGIPEVVPGLAAQVEANFSRDWTRRSRRFFDAATTRGDLSDVELGERLKEDQQVRDVFRRALNRAGEVGDEEYIDALGRLVGAACDDAAVDEAAYILGELTRLEPIQLRALLGVGFQFYKTDENGRTLNADSVPAQDADTLMATPISGRRVGSVYGLSPWIATAIVERLAAVGFIQEKNPNAGLPQSQEGFFSPPQNFTTQPHNIEYDVTGLAKAAVALLFPNINHGASIRLTGPKLL